MPKIIPPRPTVYTDAIAATICARVSVGESIDTITTDVDMPTSVTIWRWLFEQEKFREFYDRARANLVSKWAEEVLSIADDTSKDTIEVESKKGLVYTTANGAAVQRAKLMIDTRRFMLEKLAPAKFGAAPKGDSDITIVFEGFDPFAPKPKP